MGLTFILCYILTDVINKMNNADEVIQVISIGIIVASFLLNSSRYLKTIDLCKECLFILKERAVVIDETFTKLFYKLFHKFYTVECL